MSKKYKLIPYNFWNELPETKYKNEWKLPTKKDLKELKNGR